MHGASIGIINSTYDNIENKDINTSKQNIFK